MNLKELEILKMLLIQGTPKEYRQKFWLTATGARESKKQEPTYYKKLTKISQEIKDWEYLEQIQKDVPRCRYKNDKKNLEIITRILINFSIRCSSIGYCQGFNILVEFILRIMDNEVSINILL